MTDNERKAVQLSENHKRLHRRLLDAKDCLRRELGVFYSPWVFNFKAKRLISRNREFALQWKLRAFPESPISYENQQTNIGIVILKKVKS